MLPLSWNIAFRRPGGHFETIEGKGPDIVTFQEVTLDIHSSAHGL